MAAKKNQNRSSQSSIISGQGSMPTGFTQGCIVESAIETIIPTEKTDTQRWNMTGTVNN